MSLPPLRALPAPAKTLSDLEWPRLLDALAERCVTAMGRADATALPFAASREQTRTLLAEASEAAKLHDAGEPLPLEPLPDVREAVSRLRVGGVLGAGELRTLAHVLGGARVLRRYLQTRRAQAQALDRACATDPTLDRLADEIAGCFEPDGSLSDRASPRLKELRSEQQASRQRMIHRLEELMTKYEAILRDRFITEREGRWVVPVRSDAHERFPGIVHATSSSGSTLFVEPRAVIPMGNRLKVLEAEVQREEIAVYARLSSLLGDSLPSLVAAVEALARADVRAATARLAADLRLVFPEVTDEPRLELHACRHPLLALDGAVVVPSDLSLASGHGVVVSGPNAGGKTVALKTMGLAALMLRAGLPIACGDGSTLGIFDVVLTDVGDDQSLHANLSTFSAHVKNLAAILEDTQPGALVLLDELATGTDPREGEALAAGVLDSLCARGGAVAVTTHYEGLKALALADARFRNASVGFDLATMTPTFRLALDVPGRSSALAVARRFGMPGTVIERAERFLTREDVNFETVVKKLNDERAALDLARQAADAREREADGARARFEAAIAEARERDRKLVSREAEALLASVRRAREELRTAQAKLRAKKLEEHEIREAARTVEKVAAEVALGGELEPLLLSADKGAEAPREKVRATELKKGSRVWVPKLRAEAEVIEVSGAHVRVAAGPLKLTVGVDELRAGSEPAREASTLPPAKRPGTEPLETAIPTSDNSCDLRGLRADDAVSLAMTFLDRSINAGRRVAFLIHGHGTGALREAIRKELKDNRFVAYFRPGTHGEGGDGVTVVWLA
ncbi:MAG TPA: Smr/MutS family protein [Polyangiaceae bacterium]|jgi:DNA mismatch repair protein MutS2